MNQISKIRTELLQRFSTNHQALSKFKPVDSTKLENTIEHTCLKADATTETINKLCDEAKEYSFYGICIHPSFLSQASQRLTGTNVKLVTVVGFPLGTQTTQSKVFETREAIKLGAQEIDMVLHIGKLKSGLLEEVYQDIVSVVQQAKHVPVKVILETCLLSQEEKIQASILCQMAGATFVKTSTGFSHAGATVEDIKLLKQIVEDKIGIKASGGIKNLQTAKQMIEAGAHRLGTSSSVSIIREQNEKKVG